MVSPEVVCSTGTSGSAGKSIIRRSCVGAEELAESAVHLICVRQVGGVRCPAHLDEARTAGEAVVQLPRALERDGDVAIAVDHDRRTGDLAEARGDVVAPEQALTGLLYA